MAIPARTTPAAADVAVFTAGKAPNASSKMEGPLSFAAAKTHCVTLGLPLLDPVDCGNYWEVLDPALDSSRTEMSTPA